MRDCGHDDLASGDGGGERSGRGSRRCARLAPMSLSLPADPPRARSLTGVVPQMVAALDGTLGLVRTRPQRDRLRDRRARRAQPRGARRPCAVPVARRGSEEGRRAHRLPVDDGVGAHQPADRRPRRASTASSATARSSPDADEVVNQLRGWDTDGLDPVVAARGALHERVAAEGVPPSSSPKPSTPAPASPHATHARRGVPRRRPTWPSAPRIAADLAARHPGSFVYLYAPDLDAIGHKRGWQSDEWVAALERVDAAARTLGDALAPRNRARW